MLRLGVFACLILALVIGEPAGDDGAPAVVWLDDSFGEDGAAEEYADAGEGSARSDLLRRVASGDRPGLVVRPHTAPPSKAELEILAAVGEYTPLVAALPEPGAVLHVSPPASPRTQRTTAIPFTVYGATPHSIAHIRLRDQAGALDSLVVQVGDDGSAAGAFRLRPARVGWQEWRITADVVDGTTVPDVVERQTRGQPVQTNDSRPDDPSGPATLEGVTGAWVAEADPPHILLLAGAPTWESRFVVSALEEAGITLDPVLPLATDIYAAERTAPPPDLDALTVYDAVFVLPGATVGSAQQQALERYVSERGGGLLLAGDATAWRPLGLSAPAPAQEISANDIRWSLPAELAPLPAGDIRSASVLLRQLRPGSTAAAETDEGSLLALRPSGFGRLAVLGIQETWRWRMEGGYIAEHREFWRSLADWLAAPRRTPQLTIASHRNTVRIPVELRLQIPPGTEPLEVRLHRPVGSPEPLHPTPVPEEPGLWRATVLPQHTGVHAITLGTNTEPHAAFRALPPDDPDNVAPPEIWGRLALLAHASGGRTLPADSLAAWVDQWRQERASTGASRGRLLPWLLLAAALILALTEWAIRRLTPTPA